MIPMSEPTIITLTEEQIVRLQSLFDFAWERTVYRANLQAIREELGLRDKIRLPADGTACKWLEENKIKWQIQP